MNHQTGIHFCRWCCWLRVRGYGLAITPTPGYYRGLRRIARRVRAAHHAAPWAALAALAALGALIVVRRGFRRPALRP